MYQSIDAASQTAEPAAGAIESADQPADGPEPTGQLAFDQSAADSFPAEIFGAINPFFDLLFPIWIQQLPETVVYEAIEEKLRALSSCYSPDQIENSCEFFRGFVSGQYQAIEKAQAQFQLNSLEFLNPKK